VVLLLLAGCAQESESIKIGVSLPQTGFAATMGEYVERGISLGLERLSARENIELIYEDSQCQSVEGFTVARKLAEIDDVNFVIGPFCASVINPTIDYYDEHKIVRLVTGLGADTYAYRGKYQFIFLGEVKDLMKPLAEDVYDSGIRKMSILFLDGDYGKENADYFEKYFEELGGEIVFKEPFVERGEQDYRTQLLKVRNSDSEGILIASLGTHFVNVLKQAREQGMEIPVFGIRNTEDTEIIMAAGDLIEDVTYPSLTDLSSSDTKQWFFDRYVEKYGEPPESVAANAFDSFEILIKAIEVCGENVDCVHREISKIEDYEGASGKFSIDAYGNGVREPVIRIVQDGEFLLAE